MLVKGATEEYNVPDWNDIFCLNAAEPIQGWLGFGELSTENVKIITFRLILNNKRTNIQPQWYECQMFQELFDDFDVAMLYMPYTGLESCSCFLFILTLFRSYGGSVLAIAVNVCYQLCI